MWGFSSWASTATCWQIYSWPHPWWVQPHEHRVRPQRWADGAGQSISRASAEHPTRLGAARGRVPSAPPWCCSAPASLSPEMISNKTSALVWRLWLFPESKQPPWGAGTGQGCSSTARSVLWRGYFPEHFLWNIRLCDCFCCPKLFLGSDPFYPNGFLIIFCSALSEAYWNFGFVFLGSKSR